jgi:hypothetical protein
MKKKDKEYGESLINKVFDRLWLCLKFRKEGLW